MKKIIYITIILTALNSCSRTYEFWEVDKFNMVENALADSAEVAVIYYSGGPFDDEVKGGYYSHAIVVSLSSMDTLNVLTFPDFELSNISINNNVLVYHDRPTYLSITGFENLSEKMKESLKDMDSEKAHWEKFDKVARDPNFDVIADNNYKTVIGTLTKK